MQKLLLSFKCLLLLFVITACSNGQKTTKPTQSAASTQQKNFLKMKIDGKEWIADREIFGSYHFTEALGPGLINIAGVKGEAPNDQNFNINLYNTVEVGVYYVNIADFTKSKPNESVAQFALLTPSNYLCGGAIQGSQFTVQITKVSKNPQMVEATFSGTMQCVEGNKINITEGKFYYHEDND